MIPPFILLYHNRIPKRLKNMPENLFLFYDASFDF